MEMDQQLLELPLESMPRERLEKLGAKSLETYELLAILLRTGSRELNVLQLAKVVLNTFEDLFTLKMATVEELMAIHGIGRTKAIELKAAMELGIRLGTAKKTKLGHITSSQKAGECIMEELKDLYQEHLIALFLNSKNEVIKKKIIFRGGLNQAVVHPREIFREAVRFSAARIIIGHNHPSGNVTPSQADIDFTRRLSECGEMMGIELLDHFIVGDHSYCSLKEEGYF